MPGKSQYETFQMLGEEREVSPRRGEGQGTPGGPETRKGVGIPIQKHGGVSLAQSCKR